MKIGFGRNAKTSFPFASNNGVYYDITDLMKFHGGDLLEIPIPVINENIESGKLRVIQDEFKKSVPLDRINQIRDFYAFEQHVRNSRKNRGLDMIDEWFQTPIYYFTNKDCLIPADATLRKPYFTEKLDLEVEIGIVIGTSGRDINAADAMSHVYGLTLMNDWSARDIWVQTESKLNLGPSKSKDFATSMGPYITTLDEISGLWNGRSFDIRVRSYINDENFSDSNMNQMHWSIPQLIEYCSMGTELKSGDILMTGTLPGGCIFEKGEGSRPWINSGDSVEIRSEVLGDLKNLVI